MARSAREKWMEEKQWLAASRTALQERQGVQAVARKVEESLSQYGKTSRLGHAKVAAKVSLKLAEKDPDELLLNMPNVLGAAKHAALTFGWTSGSPTTSVRLDLLAGTLSVDQQTPSDELDIPE
jgi:hypothetical protein